VFYGGVSNLVQVNELVARVGDALAEALQHSPEGWRCGRFGGQTLLKGTIMDEPLDACIQDDR
jgi:hypothetical protein